MMPELDGVAEFPHVEIAPFILLIAAERADKAVAVAEPQQLPWFPRIVLVCELHIMGWVFTYRSFVKCVGHAAVELQLLVRGSIGGICLRIQLFGKQIGRAHV